MQFQRYGKFSTRELIQEDFEIGEQNRFFDHVDLKRATLRTLSPDGPEGLVGGVELEAPAGLVVVRNLVGKHPVEIGVFAYIPIVVNALVYEIRRE